MNTESKQNYQKEIGYYECAAHYSENSFTIKDDEINCAGFEYGSHGKCRFKGTGSDYKKCYRKKIR